MRIILQQVLDIPDGVSLDAPQQAVEALLAGQATAIADIRAACEETPKVHLPFANKILDLLPSADGSGLQGVALVASSASRDDLDFTVIGAIKGKPAETWSLVVPALDAAEAQAKALEVDDTRVVTAVLPGVHEPAEL